MKKTQIKLTKDLIIPKGTVFNLYGGDMRGHGYQSEDKSIFIDRLVFEGLITEKKEGNEEATTAGVSSHRLRKIRLHGKEWLTDMSPSHRSGFIASKESYESGGYSYAHMYEDKGIYRFGEKIGEFADIEFTNEYVKVTPSPEAFDRMIYSIYNACGW